MWSTIILLAAVSGDGVKCSSGYQSPNGLVNYTTDGDGNERCYSLITPPSTRGKLPVLFYFHGSGGNAAFCGHIKDTVDGNTLETLATKYQFALVCGEALQGDHGGQWDLPDIVTNTTGNRCDKTDSIDTTYMANVLKSLNEYGRYDMSRVYTSGCSMGSAFSEWSGICMWSDWFKSTTFSSYAISAFATHSTGLKIKGDGLNFPSSPDGSRWGECDGCEFWPVMPIDTNKKLKACLHDNDGDMSSFLGSTKQMDDKWTSAGNIAEMHIGTGGHCQINSFNEIVTCLDDNTGNLIYQS